MIHKPAGGRLPAGLARWSAQRVLDAFRDPLREPFGDPFRDLVLGSSCVGCGRPGRLLCASCDAELVPRPARAWPSPPPAGLTDPWAATTYDGTARAMILGHKEHRLLALARPLGALLATAIEAAVIDRLGPCPELDEVPLVLVPVPSRPSTVRERGHAPTTSITRVAAAALSATRRPTCCSALLRTRPGLADQSGLDAGARRLNLVSAFRVHPPSLRRLARAGPVHVVVCDDVLTTGATAFAAAEALAGAGALRISVAVLARTPEPSR